MTRFLRGFLSPLIASALAGCSPTGIVNSLTPRDGYTVARDVAYANGPRHRLDVYEPERGRASAPVLVFVYGGGWDSGAKEDYLFAGQAFAAAGFTALVPDYRLYPEVRYPAFVADTAAAVAWAHRTYGRPVYLVGHSAGAYNAMMVTLDERWLAREGLTVCETVAATAGLAGPYDFLPLRDPKLMTIFGPEESRPATQPIAYVDGDAPPILLIAGLDDRTVQPGNSTRLAARIREAGGDVELLTYPNVGHIALVGALAKPLRAWAPVLDDVTDFIARHPAGSSRCGGGQSLEQ